MTLERQSISKPFRIFSSHTIFFTFFRSCIVRIYKKNRRNFSSRKTKLGVWSSIVLLLENAGDSFLPVVILSESLLVMGKGDNVGYHKKTKELLCEVYKTAERVLNTTSSTYEHLKKDIELALYGKKDRAKFDKGGNVELPLNCANTQYSRSLFCNYYKIYQWLCWGSRGGCCFSESLVGTIMCVSSPGDDVGNSLCGVSVTEYNGRRWSGRWSGSNTNSDLFKDVWEKVIGKCKEESVIDKSDIKQLEKLINAAEKLKKTM
ncbi:unnamed protein product [Trypanosoma congolense IL3000]|uniref:WGS project CAEQ00000000 data, annotated contig 2259 n=1 Tax=Trypanosoma congolense (strain IL3000) TaxID=1068625 RepID=F9WCQ9_TRYCI|nr:unnamed protein product [Trypanosoma congolense IL3000]